MSLGRGLSALFDTDDTVDENLPTEGRAPRHAPIGQLRPNPFQPRRRFDEEALSDLVDSIRARGVLQPILVRPAAGRPGSYEIIAGERRWRAAQLARLHEVPIVVREFGDAEALEAALVENIQRQDLTPLEEAEGYRRLMQEFGHTQEKLGEAVGKSRSHVANMLRLLNLPEPVKAMLQDGRLSAGHGRAILTAADPVAVAKDVAGRGLNVRDTEKLVQRQAQPRRPAAAETGPKDADTRALERELTQALGLAVTVQHGGAQGAMGQGGEVRIGYRTLDQLDDLCRRLMAGRPIG